MGQRICKIVTIAQLILVIFVLSAMAQPYKIGPGDVLDISVWKNPDLTKQTIVLPDGTIHFPLVKQITAKGLCVGELENKMVEKLEKYVPDPVLTISVVQVNTVLYVTGKVHHPGRFNIQTNIDVLQALSLAGGLNPFAREKEIGIFRKIDGRTTIYPFNYKEVSQGKNLEQNIMLEPGDVIVVR